MNSFIVFSWAVIDPPIPNIITVAISCWYAFLFQLVLPCSTVYKEEPNRVNKCSHAGPSKPQPDHSIAEKKSTCGEPKCEPTHSSFLQLSPAFTFQCTPVPRCAKLHIVEWCAEAKLRGSLRQRCGWSRPSCEPKKPTGNHRTQNPGTLDFIWFHQGKLAQTQVIG